MSLLRVFRRPQSLVGMGLVVGATSVHAYAEIEAVVSFLDHRLPGEEMPLFSAALGIGPGWWYASGTDHAGLQTTFACAVLTFPLLPYVRLLSAAQQRAGFEAGAMVKIPIPVF